MGDLLLQIVLHAQIGVDDGEFYMADVIRNIDEKLRRRHPHVWGDVDVDGNSEQVRLNWQEIKERERADKDTSPRGLLDGVPAALPALAQAHQYDNRARRVGFDWADVDGVIEKIHEEIAEVLSASNEE